MNNDAYVTNNIKDSPLEDVAAEESPEFYEDDGTGELEEDTTKKDTTQSVAFDSSATTLDSSFSSFVEEGKLRELCVSSKAVSKKQKSVRKQLPTIEQQEQRRISESLAIDASIYDAFMRAGYASLRQEGRQGMVDQANKSTPKSTPVRQPNRCFRHDEKLNQLEARVANKHGIIASSEIVLPAMERPNIFVNQGGEWVFADKAKEENLPTAQPILEEEDEEMGLEFAEEWSATKQSEGHLRACCYVSFIIFFLLIGAVGWTLYGTRTKHHPREDIGLQEIVSKLQMDKDTAWRSALHWMIYDDETTAPTDTNLLQRFLLAGFFYSVTWKQPSCANVANDWCTIGQKDTLTSARPWLTAFSECEWAGLECDVLGNIVSLDLPDHTIVMETLPVQFLQRLPFLRSIRIGASQLGSLPEIPASLGRHWRTIAFDGNEIRGSIPESWYTTLPNLGVLQLARNHISGSLPDRLSNWRNLKRLDLQDNRITGSIPDVFDVLKSVAWVWLNGNRFEGRIPPTLMQIGGIYVNHTVSAISNIDLGDNRLTGGIPEVAVRRWNTLRFDRNLLSGTLPESLLRQTDTLELDVSLNRLQGTVSALFGKWEKVVLLDLSYNAFSGSLPTELALVPNLSTLNLHRNSFNGSVPEEMCRRDKLPMIEYLRADCLAEANGFVETPCLCCSECCNDEGDACAVIIP